MKKMSVLIVRNRDVGLDTEARIFEPHGVDGASWPVEEDVEDYPGV